MKIYLKEVKKVYPELQIINYNPNVYFEDFNHDSRVKINNSLFIPIVGDKFDGHEFVQDAFENGSVISLFQKDRIVSKNFKEPIIIVEDIQEGLEKLVSLMRSKIEVPVIGITGSTGKTTTREMVASILSQKGKILRSDRNFNTLWGNAQVISKYNDHKYVVLEIGMDRKGEIELQCSALKPDLGILLNVGYVHAEKLEGIEGVYQEKKELAEYLLKNNKPVFLNVDDSRVARIKEMDGEIHTFGEQSSEFKIENISITQKGTYFEFLYKGELYCVNLKIFGKGYAYNAIASIALCHNLGFSVKECIEGLEKFNGFYGRFEVKKLNNQTTLINDAYNANPTSMIMALETFSSIWGDSKLRKILVLGDMKELGVVASEKHKEIGNIVKGMKANKVFYIGEYFKDFQVGENCNNLDNLYDCLKSELGKHPNSVVLFKASNSMGLDTVINKL